MMGQPGETLERATTGQGRASALPVHLIMAADIEQDDFLLRYENGQDDSIAIGEGDGLNVFELAPEAMVGKMGGERVLLEVVDELLKTFLQVRMLLQESARTAHEAPGRNNREH